MSPQGGRSKIGKAPQVLLLDGHSLAYRAFYALPSDLKTSSGQVTNAVYGFTGMLIKALQEHKTEYLAVAFDKGAPLERSAIRPEYKAQRTAAPDEFRQQVGLIHEVLEALEIRFFEIPNVEADDLIFILAGQLVEQGNEVVVVTADRDFFQMVGPKVKVLMNRRGISDTVLYDEAAIVERYGFGPERYLDYAALRGDPSDNIQGVPGVGEKTAIGLVQKYSTLENVFKHLDELKPKIRAGLAEAQERLLTNREFFRFRSLEDLRKYGTNIDSIELSPDQLKMGEWDFKRIRTLFDALEFRVLYDRLVAERPEADEAMAGFDAALTEISSTDDLARLVEALPEGAIVMRLRGDPAKPHLAAEEVAICNADGAAVVRIGKDLPSGSVWPLLAPALRESGLVTHGSKEALQRLSAAGVELAQSAMDTEIAAYLVDPARGSYSLEELARHYLDRDLKVEAPGVAEQPSLLPEAQQLSLGEPAAQQESPGEAKDLSLGLEAAAIADLAPVLEKELRNRGGWDLLFDLELPLAGVLAKVEKAGVKVDVDYLRGMSTAITKELTALEKQIHDLAGGPFNIGSPPQLRRVLYERLELKPSKKTKTGYSTDAGVLESLREEHPIIDLILRYRERAKLKSTYIDALPPLVDPETGRVHCHFNQTVATTGRLSSDSPNLQNIPIRTAEGKAIRRAFIPEDGHVLLVADYSQIELRILAHLSRDPELLGAFQRGDDIHRLSIGKALGIEPSEVTPQLRSVGKMVSYGVTYGMGPFGLSQRLQIPVDQARTYIEGFFALYPRVREYLDGVVEQATEDGFTTTMLGRRRYVPELKSRNPRVRSLGERQALNAPIQGSAADIMKLAMIRTNEVLDDFPARMVLTVHDELVFETPSDQVEAIAPKVKDAMENVIEMTAPLEVDLAWGPNWAEAKM